MGGNADRGRLTRAPQMPVDEPERAARAGDALGLADLSTRELEILGLMAQGLFNHEIAGHLFLARETVKTHIHHVLVKLQARSRTHAVAIALQQGIFEQNHSSNHRPPGVPAAPVVPFIDLGPTHAGLTGAIAGDVVELIESGMFTDGPQVSRFEESFAEYCGCTHSIGVASGLDALRLALLAGGIKPGDQVILPANTFAATIEAVIQAGGKAVLADVSESDYNLDPAAVEEVLTPRTRFLLPVHLYGQLADMAALERLAERHPLIGAVHGAGLYLGVELVRDRDSKTPAKEEAYAICERMRELGVIVQPTGDYENVLKVKPPLCITAADAALFSETLDRVLTEGW
jgi:DNA-binding CsgD family transcriptional regulator